MKIMAPLLTMAMVLSVFGAAGCDNKTGPRKGSDCVVQFRRDALGAAAGNPIPPTSQEHNGAPTCVFGEFSRMDDDWVVLTKTPNQVNPNWEIWIPRSAILLIETLSKEPLTPGSAVPASPASQ